MSFYFAILIYQDHIPYLNQDRVRII